MLKLIRSKRGVTGISTAFTIMTIFILLGVLMPFVGEAFDPTGSVIDTDNFESEISQDSGELTSVSALDIVKSVAKMFFWTFGTFGTGIIAIFLEGVFLIMRVILVMVLIQYLPFVG